MNQSNRRPAAAPARAQQPPRRGQPPVRKPAGRPAAGYAAAPKSRDRAIPAIAIVGVVVIVLAFLLQKAWPNGWQLKTQNHAESSTAITEIHSGTVRINEIMTANKRALPAQDGGTPDWIEIMNASESAQNLANYSMAKRAGSGNVFVFPDIVLQPRECVIVFADSKLRNAADDELHAPFGLSSAGDTLLLFNPKGMAIDTVNIPALRGDESYARIRRDAWQCTFRVTPALDNTDANYALLHTLDANSPVIITELMASNASVLQDETGFYSDYIEITNRSGATVDLSGWYLSDDDANVYKWRFPQMMIEPGQSVVLFASGFDRREDPMHLHTNFALSGEGERVVLSDAKGRLMDRTEYGLLGKNQAWSRLADGGWTGDAAPSPGKF